MKHLTKSLLILALISIGTKLNAQNIVTTGVTDPNTCNGSAYLADSYMYSNLVWMQGGTVLQTGGDSITGLCYGTYALSVTDSIGSTYSATFFIDTVAFNPCGGFSAIVQPTNASGIGQCDGTAFANPIGGSAPYNYLWDNGSTGSQTGNLCAGSYSVSISDANGCVYSTYYTIYDDSTGNGPCSGFGVYFDNVVQASINNCDGSAHAVAIGGNGNYTYQWSNGVSGDLATGLCPGSAYTVTATDGNGCSATTSIYIYSDTMWNNYLYGNVYTYNTSSDGVCDGSAYVDVYGGTAPYSFVHSNGDLTQMASGLCAGIYSVYVTDAGGDTLLLNYVIVDPSSVYNGGGYQDSSVVDTMGMSLVEDCLIDYFSLNMVFISDIQYITQDSIVVTWSVVDGNGTSTFLQSYTISTGAGVYELILEIFCPQKSTDKVIYATDRIYFDPALLQLNEQKSAVLSVYPNPFNDVLTIQMEEAGKTKITLSDLSGRVVYNGGSDQKTIQLDLGFLAKGQYLVRVSNDKNSFTKVVLK